MRLYQTLLVALGLLALLAGLWSESNAG